ncbi:MAG TPA: DegT/DnrJ/EryC1/StrS family aminotransferase [Polyangiaceae bacterium]|nr:DegT/DnrJ/EryC1/StrS family aminotransferase [Polyangiaceae bacterium]
MIPFVDLKTQYESIKPEIDAAVLNVFATTQFVLGSAVASFEKAFASYCSAEQAIACSTGTSALHLALLAAGVGRGDEVITTPFTFLATVSAIDYTGAKPVFVDIANDSVTIDPSKIEQAITPKTKAILPVHLHGCPADMDPILEIAKKHNLIVIEDAAQAHGAEYKGRRCGSMGALGCFSFYPGKNLGAYGEGGAITTSNAEYAKTLRKLRDWGSDRKYYHDLKGFNYRMEGVQGAVLGVKMKYIEGWTESRRRLAARYNELLAGTPYGLPPSVPNSRHVYHVYAVRHARRDALQSYLQEKGVATGIHYPVPVHLQRCFAELGHKPGDFPNSERAANEVLSLPMFPELTDAQQDVVIAALKEWPAK